MDSYLILALKIGEQRIREKFLSLRFVWVAALNNERFRHLTIRLRLRYTYFMQDKHIDCSAILRCGIINEYIAMDVHTA